MELDRKQFYQSRSGAVIGAARDIAAKPDDMTQRGGAASRTHGRSPFQKQSARMGRSDFFSKQCVGGDGHPVGGKRHLNDPLIHEPGVGAFSETVRIQNSRGGDRREF